MLWVIRGTFPEVVPAGGGEERAWIVAYLKARHHFLETHPREIVRRTTYRMRCLTGEIVRGNWELEMLPIVANGVRVGVGTPASPRRLHADRSPYTHSNSESSYLK